MELYLNLHYFTTFLSVLICALSLFYFYRHYSLVPNHTTRKRKPVQKYPTPGLKILSEGSKPAIEYTTSSLSSVLASLTLLSVIAVHGLGATPEWAWVAKVKQPGKPGEEKLVNWLEAPAMLPKELPNARIMAFSYESKWLLEGLKQRRALCGIQLLEALNNLRKKVFF
jgi:hypothetical protein